MNRATVDRRDRDRPPPGRRAGDVPRAGRPARGARPAGLRTRVLLRIGSRPMWKRIALAAAAALLTLPAAAQARVTQAETVLPPGQLGLRADRRTSEPAPGRPAGLVPVVRVQARGLRPARDERDAVHRRDDHARRVRRPEHPRRQRPRPVEGRRLRGRAGPARPARAVPARDPGPPRRGARRSRAASASDIVARRDYYTTAELQRMLKQLPGLAARTLRRVRRGRQRVDRQGRRRPDAGAARVHAARPHAGAVAGGRLGLDRRPARAHDPERRRQRARRTGRRCASSAPSASTACCRCGARARSRRSRPSAGKFPSTPGRTRKDERVGFKRSQQVPQAA